MLPDGLLLPFSCFSLSKIEISCFQVGLRCLIFFSKIKIEYMHDAIYFVQDQDFVHA
jgi:hypothetical protein